jgi:tetratricopeptide (TPR) repeat protein
MLLDYLLGRGIDSAGRTVRHAFSFPWCYPVAGELLARAQAMGFPEPAAPAPGNGCIVSVGIDAADKAKVWLWQLVPQAANQERTEFKGGAAQAAQLAGKLATRDLPFVVEPDPIQRGVRWSATPILGRHELPSILDGTSFGLAFFLCHVSLLLDQAIPSTLLASAAVDPSGAVVPVAFIERKTKWIASAALGVTRLLVHSSQEQEARKAAEEQGRKIEVVPVDTLRQAVKEAFEGLDAAMAQRWSDPALARRSATVLYRMALENAPGLLSHRCVLESSRKLGSFLKDDASEQGRTALARVRAAERIAGRHEGLAGQALQWPKDDELRALPQPVRIGLLAHVVQSAADSSDALVCDFVPLALQWLPVPSDRSLEHLRLAGAIGRAQASAGDYESALQNLRDTVLGWFAVFAEHEASYALCEYVRLLGLLGKREELGVAARNWLASFETDPRTEDVAVAYVRMALGRAYVQAGAPEEGLRYLQDAPAVQWTATRDEVRFGRLRWQARAYDELGKSEEAAACRARLEQQAPESDYQLLATLDRQLRCREDPSGTLSALAKHNCCGQDVQRLLDRVQGKTSREQCAYVTEHYRY